MPRCPWASGINKMTEFCIKYNQYRSARRNNLNENFNESVWGETMHLLCMAFLPASSPWLAANFRFLPWSLIYFPTTFQPWSHICTLTLRKIGMLWAYEKQSDFPWVTDKDRQVLSAKAKCNSLLGAERGNEPKFKRSSKFVANKLLEIPVKFKN